MKTKSISIPPDANEAHRQTDHHPEGTQLPLSSKRVVCIGFSSIFKDLNQLKKLFGSFLPGISLKTELPDLKKRPSLPRQGIMQINRLNSWF